jgi:DNA-binding transcriptional LysR family regulator
MLDHRMETFIAVCKVMNYREAAEMLHITQPAVTQHIQFLEREYGCRLFQYENRRLIKTKEAQLLEEHVRASRQMELSLKQKLRDSKIRELKIGATKTIGDYVITDRIQRYLSKEENALTLVVDNTEHLLRLLEQNELDFAIIEGYFDKKHFDSQLFRKEPFVGICKKDHPFANKEIRIAEIMEETIIHREEGSGTRAILEEKLQGYNESLMRFKRQICISSFKMILDLVKKGMGISFVYKVLAESDPDIATFTFQGEPIVREFNIVYLKHANLQEKIDWFFEEDMYD